MASLYGILYKMLEDHQDMSKLSLRIQEGALSASKTPTQPPAQTKLVPIAQAAKATVQNESRIQPGKDHQAMNKSAIIVYVVLMTINSAVWFGFFYMLARYGL